MFWHLKCHLQGVSCEHAEKGANVVESNEGWELYIVTGGMVAF
jgi:hypothetical protein